jgi:hypothetical protein
MSCAPAWRRSSTGSRSTPIPTSRSIQPIASALASIASIADTGARSYNAANAPPAGNSGHTGGRIRATRPPSWSIEIGTSSRPDSARNASVSRRNCSLSTMLRRNST